MNVVIYARYSSDKQREESIEGQLKFCRAYAKDKGYDIINEYIDKAMSAKTANRPSFQKMIRDSSKKQFQGVIVYQLDRFARNRVDSAKYKTILSKNGVKVYSANENIAEGASGILLESVIEGLAEYYSAELSEKVTRGMNINADKCLSNGGVTPFGYKIQNKHYVIDQEAAPIVREIFTMYANGMKAKDICDNLNARKIKTGTGSKFNKNSLHSILKNRKYLGIYIYKGVETPGGMPQIVDNDLFDKVSEQMAINKKLPARARAKTEYLLTTKLFCGYCKEMMIGHSANKKSKGGIKYNYYKCKNTGANRHCKKKMIRKDYIENIVIDACEKFLTMPNIQRIAKETVRIAKSYDDREELKHLNHLLECAEREKENQVAALRSCKSDLVRDIIFNDLERIAIEIEKLQKQIDIEKSRHHIVTEEQIIKFLSGLKKDEKKDVMYRKTLIKVMVNRIFLYDDKVTITFNSGCNEVTITDSLLDEINTKLTGKGFCLLRNEVHHFYEHTDSSVYVCSFFMY